MKSWSTTIISFSPAKLGMQVAPKHDHNAMVRARSEQGHRMSCLCELTGNPNLEELKTLGRPANKAFFTRKTGNLVHLATSRLAVQKLECEIFLGRCRISWGSSMFDGSCTIIICVWLDVLLVRGRLFVAHIISLNLGFSENGVPLNP
jgi:hypothetical protein